MATPEKAISGFPSATTISESDVLLGNVDGQTKQITPTILRARLNEGNQTFSGDVTATSFTGNGSSLTGIGTGTGGIINTGSTTIGADSDINGSGVVDIQTRNISRINVSNDGKVGVGMIAVKNLDISGEIRASTGILFGADTSAANTLDDYEEGTWAANCALAVPGDSSNTVVTATYTKIGDRIFSDCDVSFTKGTGTGALTITGLPYASGGSGFTPGSIESDNIGLDGYYLSVFLGNGSSTINMQLQAESVLSNLPVLDVYMGATVIVRISINYKI